MSARGRATAALGRISPGRDRGGDPGAPIIPMLIRDAQAGEEHVADALDALGWLSWQMDLELAAVCRWAFRSRMTLSSCRRGPARDHLLGRALVEPGATVLASAGVNACLGEIAPMDGGRWTLAAVDPAEVVGWFAQFMPDLLAGVRSEVRSGL